MLELLLLLAQLLVLGLHLVDLGLRRRLARQGLLGQVVASLGHGLLGLVLEVVDGVAQLRLLQLDALAGGGDVDQGAAHLRELLEHLLVGEVEGLGRVLGRVEDPVRLGLDDVVRP